MLATVLDRTQYWISEDDRYGTEHIVSVTKPVYVNPEVTYDQFKPGEVIQVLTALLLDRPERIRYDIAGFSDNGFGGIKQVFCDDADGVISLHAKVIDGTQPFNPTQEER